MSYAPVISHGIEIKPVTHSKTGTTMRDRSMLLKAYNGKPHKFVFYLVPGFTMIAFTSALEPLRIANLLAGKRLYEWEVVSGSNSEVTSSSGTEISVTTKLEEVENADLIFVVGGLLAYQANNGKILPWLRRMDRKGIPLGAICSGTYLLAKAGLLQSHSCTIHWEYSASLVEGFPDIDVVPEIFEIDGNRITCSGGTAAIDMILKIISMSHAYELVANVADQLLHERIRDENDQQRMPLTARLGVRHPKLLAVIKLMEGNLEEPLTRMQLATDANLSTRQLERLFRKYLNRSPARYYLELRLNKARLLLLQTDMSVIDVALACGFVSASHFSKCYRDFFGKTPRKERDISPAVEA